MISLKNTLNAIATSISALQSGKANIPTVGSNYIKFHGIGICWGSFAQSYASGGQQRTTVNYPISFTSTPVGFVATQDVMRGYGSGTPNGYGIVPSISQAYVDVWVNRTYGSGTNLVYWFVIGNV